MKFERAVTSCLALADAYRPGLQALRRADRNRICAGNSRRLCGSVDIDAALRARFPNDPRWDYAIGLAANGDDLVCWVEVHPADTSEVRTVLAKIDWLHAWLNSTETASLATMKAEFVWVASGHVRILKNSPQYRRLSAAGLRLVGRLQLT